jgi:hypothetical protein
MLCFESKMLTNEATEAVSNNRVEFDCVTVEFC